MSFYWPERIVSIPVCPKDYSYTKYLSPWEKKLCTRCKEERTKYLHTEGPWDNEEFQLANCTPC